MAQIIFVRHGESSANVDRVLAGRTPGVALTERGRAQAAALASRLGDFAPEIVLRSSLLRCEQTVELAVPGAAALEAPEFDEVDYGHWSGESLESLARLPQWKDLMRDPAGMAFPGGETLAEASARTVAGVARVVHRLREIEAGRRTRGDEKDEQPARPAIAVIVSHGDIVKFALLDALGAGVAGLHRISVANGSLSVIDYRDADNPNVCAVSVTAAAQARAGTLGG